MRALPFTSALAVLVLAGSASAEDTERYRLERTASGFVRMDTATGEMSFCEERSGRLSCRPAQDAKAVPADRVEALAGRVEELERRLAALEGRAPAEPGLPSEEEFEQTMNFMERFLRRFWGVAKDLERAPDPEAPAPDRT